MELTYAEVEELLARLHNVHSLRRTALMGRIKNLQRLGWPEGTNVGKGARVRYDTRRVLSLVVAFELMAAGVTPDRAVTLLSLLLKHQLPTAFLAAIKSANAESYKVELNTVANTVDGQTGKAYFHGVGDVLLVLDPDSLQPLRIDEDLPFDATIVSDETGSLTHYMRGFHRRRAAVINFSLLLEHLAEALEGIAALDLAIMERDLEQWKQSIEIRHGDDQEA